MTDVYAAANGAGVVEGRICLPRTGLWTAVLRLETNQPVGPAVTLSFLGGFELKGTVYRGGVEADVAEVHLVGGKGGMGKVLSPRFYRSVPARLPLQDVLREAGEQLAEASSEASVLSASLESFSRNEGPAGRQLALLAQLLNTTWRAEPGGSIRLGSDRYAQSSVAYELIREYPAQGLVEVYLEHPALLPGSSFLGQKVSYVEHRIGSQLRTRVWFER